MDDEFIEVNFSDTSTLLLQTIVTDSVLTYSPFEPLLEYMLGDLNDPIFGFSEAKF